MWFVVVINFINQTLTLLIVTTISSLEMAPPSLLFSLLSFTSDPLSTSSIGLKTVPGLANTSGIFCSGLKYTHEPLPELLLEFNIWRLRLAPGKCWYGWKSRVVGLTEIHIWKSWAFILPKLLVDFQWFEFSLEIGLFSIKMIFRSSALIKLSQSFFRLI